MDLVTFMYEKSYFAKSKQVIASKLEMHCRAMNLEGSIVLFLARPWFRIKVHPINLNKNQVCCKFCSTSKLCADFQLFSDVQTFLIYRDQVN